MKSEFTSQARKDLEKFNEKQLNAIKNKVEEIEEDPTGETSKLIRVAGREIYRAKIKQDRSGEIDHRIIYDIRDRKIVIYSVIDRDEGYNKEELDNRL